MPTVRSWEEEEGAGRLRVETAGEEDDAALTLGAKLRVC